MTKHPNNPTIVFFGTPDYVLPVVEALNTRFKIAAVVTQPPKPVGRKQVQEKSPVACCAEKHNIPVLTNSTTLRPPANAVELRAGRVVEKADVGVLASYGKIIPKEIIDFFPHGIINIHPSLLPKYRGASPIAAAIAAGEEKTGVSIIKLDEKMDHGPILAQFTEEILPDDTGGVLRQRLFEKASKRIAALLNCYIAGEIILLKQDHSKATFTTLIKKEHGFIPPKYLAAAIEGKTIQEKWSIPFIKDYSLIPQESSSRLMPSVHCLERFIRSLDPWPGTFTSVKLKVKPFGFAQGESEKLEKRLKILKAHTEDGRLVLDQVQLEGKKPVSWQQYVEGYPETKFGKDA